MMPPHCAVCELDLHKLKDNETVSGSFHIVGFKKTKEQEEFEKTRPQGWVGQPANLVWFCNKHAEIAAKYPDLTKGEALKKIKEELNLP